MVRLNENDGSITPLLILILLAMVTTSFGFVEILHYWHRTVVLQLTLDRCAGETAQELARVLERIDAFNSGIEATRLALAAATLIPGARPPLQTALAAAVISQDRWREGWRIREQLWLARSGCRFGAGDQAPPLPGLRFIRPPPDVIGPRPLEWPGEQPAEFQIWLRHPPRVAATKVRKKNDPRSIPSGWSGLNWTPEWATAPRSFGTITD